MTSVEEPPGDDPRDAALQRVLWQLSEQEAQIVRQRFGLDDGKMRSLTEIERQFGVGREAVRDIEKTTVEKLWRERSRDLGDPPDNTQN